LNKIEIYKANEILENRYYQVPQELFENRLYKDKLNSDSKILYGFLLDRLTLSKKNNWINENGEVYLIFTRQEVQSKLNLSDKTVSKAFKQLTGVGLLAEKRQGLGKPNLIFVGKIQHEEITEVAEPENLRFKNRKNYDSGDGETPATDTENLRGINTNNINTNIINPNSINHLKEEGKQFLDKIKKQCYLEEFEDGDREILEEVIDTLYGVDFLKVGSVTVNHLKIVSKLEHINKSNLHQLLDVLEGTPNIQKRANYLMICLYNNLGTNYYRAENKKPNQYEKREYSDEFFKSLEAKMQERMIESIANP